MVRVCCLIAACFFALALAPIQPGFGLDSATIDSSDHGGAFGGSLSLPAITGGAASADANPGQVFYYNNAGVGYYLMNKFAPQFPSYPAPIQPEKQINEFGGLGARLGFWRAPSGFYYRWYPVVYIPGCVYSTEAQTYKIESGRICVATPAIDTILGDLESFLQDARAKRQLSCASYERFMQRLHLIAAGLSKANASGGGTSTESAVDIQRNLDLLLGDVVHAMNN